MATITLTEFLLRMRRLGNYPSSGTNHPASPISDTFLTDCLNNAISDYSDILDARWQGYRDTQATLATVANTATKALPTDLRTALAVDILEAGYYRPLKRLQNGRTYPFQAAAGIPIGYMLIGANLEFFPTPDAVYTVRVRYIPQATVLSSGGTTSMDIPNRWERYVVQLALLEVDQQQERSIQDRLSVIAKLEAAVTAAAGDRNVAEPEYIPVPGDRAGWFLP